MFFEFSISAVLTLLVNGIVRPSSEYVGEDLRRVDTWLKVIDVLATSSDRADLLEKREFLIHMRAWTLHVISDSLVGSESESCVRAAREYLESERALDQDGEFAAMGMPELEGMHPDVFPLDQIHEGNLFRDSWLSDGMTWPYLTRDMYTMA